MAAKIDFFISYNKADRQWAEWIAWQLNEAGFSTVLQAWDFRPGSNLVSEMQKATANSERTVAVLSEAFLKSGFAEAEWAAAFSQDPTGEHGTLLPVRVAECEPEGLLSQVVYIDLLGADEARARELLLAGVNRQPAKPATAPSFPEPAGQASRAQAASMSMRVSGPIVLEGLRTFQLEVRAESIPEQGYLGWQTLLHHDSLVYKVRDNQDEFVWPEANLAVALRTSGHQKGAETWVVHGVLSGLLPPLPQSHHIGPLLRVMLQCPQGQLTEAHSHKVYLIPHSKAHTSGAGFLNKDEVTPAKAIGSAQLPGFGTTDIVGGIDVACSP